MFYLLFYAAMVVALYFLFARFGVWHWRNYLLPFVVCVIGPALSLLVLFGPLNTVFYYDCRARREGYDLAVDLERLA
jgi:hypothetical protein